MTPWMKILCSYIAAVTKQKEGEKTHTHTHWDSYLLLVNNQCSQSIFFIHSVIHTVMFSDADEDLSEVLELCDALAKTSTNARPHSHV